MAVGARRDQDRAGEGSRGQEYAEKSRREQEGPGAGRRGQEATEGARREQGRARGARRGQEISGGIRRGLISISPAPWLHFSKLISVYTSNSRYSDQPMSR